MHANIIRVLRTCTYIGKYTYIYMRKYIYVWIYVFYLYNIHIPPTIEMSCLEENRQGT